MLGIAIFMCGTLVTLIPGLAAIITGFFINAFGFFFAHSSASSWVSHQATEGRASASSLYLVFYYVGASSGGFYLQPFWQWQEWPGVVLASLLILSVTLSLSMWLHRRTTKRNLLSCHA